jgi:hypothetical protein
MCSSETCIAGCIDKYVKYILYSEGSQTTTYIPSVIFNFTLEHTTRLRFGAHHSEGGKKSRLEMTGAHHPQVYADDDEKT